MHIVNIIVKIHDGLPDREETLRKAVENRLRGITQDYAAIEAYTVERSVTTLVPPWEKPARVRFRVEKLERPEHWGDWHDKPAKWRVVSEPASALEVQKFSTRKEAELYARLRRNAERAGLGAQIAIREYAATI